MPIGSVVVLGGGSAGLMAAVTLKRKLPGLQVTVVRSPDIGIIGVGEGTTLSFPRHFFEYLRLKPQDFYRQAEPTWKLGIRFLWGKRSEFYYTFAYELEKRLPDLTRNCGFYYGDEDTWAGPISAFMAHDKAFARRSDGRPQFHNHHGFHIENKKLVGWLDSVARAFGVQFIDATITPEPGPSGIEALVTADGARLTADLFIDASGFRSELLGRTLNEPYISYADSLFCDRAVIGGWGRTDEPVHPYTVAETMDAGWCWQIEHEHFINRGYVYASAFISDEAAREEFLKKNPKVSNEPRVVKFRSGRYQRNWVGNVVGIGNAVGFVEPLEATALQVICVEVNTLTESLVDSLCEPTPSLIELYNRFNAEAWDDIRDFLSVHYRFNTRLDTPFWQACRSDTQLHGAELVVRYYQENGPSVLAGSQLLHPSNSFGMEGYLALLLGQSVPHGKGYSAPTQEQGIWRNHYKRWGSEAQRALNVPQCLEAIRRLGIQ